MGVLIIIMAALLFVSAFFSASETALFSLPRSRAKGGSVEKVLADQRSLLITILLGNMFVNVLYSSLASLVVVQTAEKHGEAGLLVSSAVALLGLIIFGEVVPKNLALAVPEILSKISAPVLLVFGTAISPIRRFFSVVTRILTQTILGPGTVPQEKLTTEELEKIISRGHAEGMLGTTQEEFIQDVIDLAELRVHEIMVPRTEIGMTDVSAGTRGVLKTASDMRITKVPVYDGNTDNILGICHVKDLIISPDAGLAGIVRKAQYVPETMKVEDLLVYFHKATDSVALVVDEYGALAGLVTVEDASEEIVGEILDEYDAARRNVVPLGSGKFLVSGRMPRREFADHFGVELPEEKADTVAGFVLAKLGRLPAEGETLETDGLKFSTARIKKNRILSVHVERLENETGGNGGGGNG